MVFKPFLSYLTFIILELDKAYLACVLYGGPMAFVSVAAVGISE